MIKSRLKVWISISLVALLVALIFPMAARAITITDLAQVAAGPYHTVGLKSDGTVVAVGMNYSGQCEVDDWGGIRQVAAGADHTVGRRERTVVAVGSNSSGKCEVDDWGGIVQVAAGLNHTVGLRFDRTVLAAGNNDYGQCNVGDWTNIVQVAAGALQTLGLKSDRTVVAEGDNSSGQCNVGGWSDIIQVAASRYHTVGLKQDGKVVAAGNNDYGECNVGGWSDIIQVAAGVGHTVGLRGDGTVVATGLNDYGQCEVGGWSDIIQVAASRYHTVGLKSDGTVLATGNNDYGQCNVDDWRLLMPYDEGYIAGYEAGVSSTTCYEEGYQAGYQAGVDSCADTGYDEGYTAGHTAGYDAGYQAGEDSCADTIAELQADVDELNNQLAACCDTTPPVTITDLTASPNATSIDLYWTAPGDDGNTGTASTYEIRYSMSLINAGNWGSATLCINDMTPRPAGDPEAFTVTELSSNTLYYFAIKTADEVPNWSDLSNVASGTTAANSPPQVTNVTASQGSPIVNITYDVSDAEQSQVGISFEYWDGSSWQACITTTGEGTQTTGTGKSGTWTAKTDFDEHFMTDCKIRVTADDGQAENNIGSAQSSPFTLDTEDPTGHDCHTPTNGASGISINPNLACRSASDNSQPISYYFQLAENDTFSLGLQESDWQNGTTWSPSTLGYNKQYFWRMKAKDNYDNESDYISTFNFTTESAPNTPPEVTNVTASQSSPIVNITYDVFDAEQSQVDISFEYWDGSSWQACITTTGEGTQTTGTGKSGTWNAKAEFDEQFMTDCKIRVTADDGQDENNTGSSESSPFTLDTKDPTGYGCSTPTNGATGVSINPDLTCRTASDDSLPISYYFQLARNDTFRWRLRESGWQTSTTWSPPAYFGRYFWRMKAKDSYGNETDYSSTFSFNIGRFRFPWWPYD